MPLENPIPSISQRVTELNNRHRDSDASVVLRDVLGDALFGPIALVSSFGAEAVVLLHMVSEIDKATPIIFIDTEMLFPQTLAYQRKLAEDFGLSDVRRITPSREAVFLRDPDNLMHLADKNSCCALRKTEPLEDALAGFDVWISGRKRFQGGVRAEMALFESEDDKRIKVNPLAHWTREDVADYIAANNLPRHPLVAKGYPSIGCEPCTTPVSSGEDERAGRWRDEEKTECGIHFMNDDKQTPDANVIVNDNGFASDDWNRGYSSFEDIEAAPESQSAALAIDLPNDFDAVKLLPWIDQIDLVRIEFPVFSDGRGFSLAQRLRLLGYHGRLRAKGHLLADQYAMARRSGFDEVEIDQALAARQPEPQWLARADWQARNYQHRFQQSA
ncbi:phosphoadenosine phosphosulfate reductase [Rhodobacterales bacterium 52_120_T64]|nr:phosphoadenosine phosphosulfate reductase [Rhodobacterales bacterium 52_120_T64]